MKNNKLAYLLIFIANIIFGLSFLFTKVSLVYTSPLILVAHRFILAFLIMNILILFKIQKITIKNKPIKKLILLGLIQPVFYFIFETYGIEMTSSSFAGIILGLLPIFGSLCGAFFLKEEIKKSQVLLIFLSVLGIFFTTFMGEIKFSISGLILLLLAVLSAALFSTLSSFLSKEVSAFERTYTMFALGSICFSIMALFSINGNLSLFLEPLYNINYLKGLFYLGFLSSVVAFFFINYSLSKVSVSSQTLLSNFSTVVSILGGVIFLHESFNLAQMIGIILILISVISISLLKH